MYERSPEKAAGISIERNGWMVTVGTRYLRLCRMFNVIELSEFLEKTTYRTHLREKILKSFGFMSGFTITAIIMLTCTLVYIKSILE